MPRLTADDARLAHEGVAENWRQEVRLDDGNHRGEDLLMAHLVRIQPRDEVLPSPFRNVGGGGDVLYRVVGILLRGRYVEQ